MDDVRVNGNKIFANVPAMLDSGSNLIYGDGERVSELYRRLGGTLKKYKGINFYYCEFRFRSVPCFYRQPAVPCDSFPTVSFTFSGKTFAIPPGVLRLHPIEEGSSNCFSAIVADTSPTGESQ
jgi:cathepsin D